METRTSRHKDLDHHSHQPSSSSPRNTVCVLSDHQPANHKEFELTVIGTEEATVNTGRSKEHCAQGIISEFEDARTQRISSESDIVMLEGQNEHCAQAIISEFEDARTQRISSESDIVMFEGQNEHCAQAIISEFEDARIQEVNSELNTVVIKAEIHAENTDAQHMPENTAREQVMFSMDRTT